MQDRVRFRPSPPNANCGCSAGLRGFQGSTNTSGAARAGLRQSFDGVVHCFVHLRQNRSAAATAFQRADCQSVFAVGDPALAKRTWKDGDGGFIAVRAAERARVTAMTEHSGTSPGALRGAALARHLCGRRRALPRKLNTKNLPAARGPDAVARRHHSTKLYYRK